MTRKLRQLLFYTSIIIFILMSAILVIYAEGYKFDFFDWQFVKTGSLQLKTNRSAEIYIYDKLIGETSFFTDAFTLNRLLPRTYNLRVQNSDYEIWSKMVDIKAGLVTDFPRIVLVSKNLSTDIIASSSFNNITKINFDVQNNYAVVFSGNKSEQINLINGKRQLITPSAIPTASINPPDAQEDLIIKVSRPPVLNAKSIVSPDKAEGIWFNEHEIWIQWLEDMKYQPFKKAGDIQLITRYSETIKDIQWYRDSSHLFVNVGNIITFIEIDTRGGMNSYDLTTLNSPFYYLPNSNSIYKFEGPNLVRITIF